MNNKIEKDLKDKLSIVDFNVDVVVNGVDDFWKINFKNMSTKDVMKYHFLNTKVIFMFYNWYVALHGFATRKARY